MGGISTGKIGMGGISGILDMYAGEGLLLRGGRHFWGITMGGTEKFDEFTCLIC